MSQKSKIEWTQSTWNPTTGCIILTHFRLKVIAISLLMILLKKSFISSVVNSEAIQAIIIPPVAIIVGLGGLGRKNEIIPPPTMAKKPHNNDAENETTKLVSCLPFS